MRSKRILIMGLPGAGKTTLAKALLPRLNAVHFNADEVRANVHKDLGFSLEDRLEHARRMGWLCEQVARTGAYAIADFICPTAETRAAFGEAFTVWVDRIAEGRFADTNRMFEPPGRYDIRVTADGPPEFWAEKVATTLRPLFDPKKPTALLIGRYQPFHEGHKALVEAALARVGQVCIGIRDTHGVDDKNPFSFDFVRARIEEALRTHTGRFVVVQLPNIAAVFYGRDVGYVVEKIDLDDPSLHAISGTQRRQQILGGSGGHADRPL